MQANWREIASVFNEQNDFVLATIVATRGATYKKAGAMILINTQGECFGLLSGGCLEADISLHAKEVLAKQKSEIISYDLSTDADLLWGLGLGCDGAIDILLQPLLVSNNHLGFCNLLNSIKAQQSGYYRQNLPFATSEGEHEQSVRQNHQPYAEFILSEHFYSSIKNNQSSSIPDPDQTSQTCIVTPIKPPINLLICGAGPDVVPVAKFAEQMGWQVTLWDHRQNHLNQQHFSAYHQQCLRANDTTIEDYSVFDAAIVMTHNITMDGEYLAKLIASSPEKLSYIGVLGPKARRDKLLNACGVQFSQVQARVYGPVGLDLGGRGPEAIALSITSEIQQHFFSKITNKNHNEQSVICHVNELIFTKDKALEMLTGIEYV